jgi:hypothetical protein
MSMSFERKKTIFLLTFEDPELEGLEVRCKSATVSAMQGIMHAARAAESDPDEAFALFAKFAEYLISWNLTDEGEPVPCGAHGLMQQELGFAMSIVMAWLGGMTGGNKGPLGPRSDDGTQRLAESIPMDVLSPSLLS